jgi:hypothetical protein
MACTAAAVSAGVSRHDGGTAAAKSAPPPERTAYLLAVASVAVDEEEEEEEEGGGSARYLSDAAEVEAHRPMRTVTRETRETPSVTYCT